VYGLPQSGIFANQVIARRLAVHGYHQTKCTPGMWRHVRRPIQVTLVVDDFGVPYLGQEHAQHLIDAMETDYTVSKFWNGGRYCGITLKWYHTNKDAQLSMPGCIKDAPLLYQSAHCNKSQGNHGYTSSINAGKLPSDGSASIRGQCQIIARRRCHGDALWQDPHQFHLHDEPMAQRHDYAIFTRASTAYHWRLRRQDVK
jgi:hypothetical protein